jgi:hypothetical protein
MVVFLQSSNLSSARTRHEMPAQKADSALSLRILQLARPRKFLPPVSRKMDPSM